MFVRVLEAYFQGLQDFFNPFKIYFDTVYDSNIENIKKYMSGYNLFQQFKPKDLDSAYITEDLLNSLRANRPGGGSYNVIQYKFNPLRLTDLHPNNEYYYIRYDKKQLVITDSKRNFIELDRDQELFLMAEFEAEQKKQPNSPVERTIHDGIVGDIEPSIDNAKATILERLGVYCDLELECRFLTTNTSIFEDFQVLYCAMLQGRNPPVFMQLKDAPDIKYPITTRYAEIDSAERLDAEQYGNLSMIGFSVTISTMFLSSYVKRSMPVNKVSVFSEIQASKNR